MRNQILEIIYQAIDEINTERDVADQLTKTETTVILGSDGKLDSLGLVNLIVSLEEAINDTLDIEITLADERAMSRESSPFKTVASLADYIQVLVAENKNG